MGGDLAGIEAGLGRIAALGATALYLNPVFAAGSNHGYDTNDYETVDPRFGTNGGLRRLVASAHARGMRVILDGVFNHTSPEFFAFRDLRAQGAASAYREWYFPLAFPIVVAPGQRTYRTFAGVPTMPKLNLENPAARDYFLGIGKKWIREAGVDGWRLDVADEIAPSFLRAFRREVKGAKSDAYIVGEMWGDARRMVQGDQADGTMNYRWRDATLRLVNREITPAEYVRLLQEIAASVPVAGRDAQFNVLGSHDTARLRTVLGGSEPRQRLAVMIQMFSPGVPVIYYGDEYGLEGGKEPASRNALPPVPTPKMLRTEAFYREAIALRRSLARRGAFTARADGDVLTLAYPGGPMLIANLGTRPLPTPPGRLLAGDATAVEAGGYAIIAGSLFGPPGSTGIHTARE